MFKRLFILSGVIAFLLACAMMWFWYLPNHSDNSSVPAEIETEQGIIASDADSTEATNTAK
ncbi:MAG: hypothetical protein ACPGD8_01780 [Flavobacteriales bacterium]